MRTKYTLGDFVFHHSRKGSLYEGIYLYQIGRVEIHRRTGRVAYYGDENEFRLCDHRDEPLFIAFEEDLFDSFEEAWAACGAQITAALNRPRYNFAEVLMARRASGAPCAKEIISARAAEKRAAKEAEKARKKAEREAKKAVRSK